MCKSVMRSTQKDVDFECLVTFKCNAGYLQGAYYRVSAALVYGRVPAYFEESIKNIHLLIIVQHFYYISIIYKIISIIYIIIYICLMYIYI